jgi:hypothetical protein
MTLIRVVGAVLFAGAVQSAAAQSADSVPLSRVTVGTTVRVWSQNPSRHKLTAVYSGSTANSIKLTERFGSEPVAPEFPSAIPLAELQRLEAFNGRKPSGSFFLTRTLVGAAIGSFLGATVGAAIDNGMQNPASNRPLGVFMFGAIGFATGTVGGAIAGASGRPVWAPVSLSR